MKKILLMMLAAAVMCCCTAGDKVPALDAPQEFRGAWLHIIGQTQYARMSAEQTRAYLKRQVDSLCLCGCNAVIWQVRPQADAGYPSMLEPWSRWMTGTAGQAPQPQWDPLQWMIDLCHERGMELHAWINPYRVTSSVDEQLPPGHIYYDHPEWFVKYADGKIYFDPGLPQSRDFIEDVVRDLLTRYDVDAIHMDDYFYPYPVQGADFPDDASYNRYGIGWDRGDWRRHNVDLLIEQLHNAIAQVKPWVRLGISPFGIWRNQSSDPQGSATNGLQCYDALYADCLRWTRLGWVDYMAPQLYWELEHQRASDLTLMHWWNDHANGRHMYYGQALRNVMDHRDVATENGDTLNPTQLDHKLRLQRSLEHVQGVVWWPGYTITANYKGVADSLRRQCPPALIPPYTWLDNTPPAPVLKVNEKEIDGRKCLTWQVTPTSDPLQQAVRFAVYRWPKKGKHPQAELIGVTGRCYLELPNGGKGKWRYAVTAIDRCWNQSR